MEITISHKGRAIKTAHVTGTGLPERALAFAMDHHNEHKGSLFGWSVREVEDGYLVELFTD